MKKFLSFAAVIAMVAMLVCAFPVAVSAFDAPIPPEIVITEMDCNPSGADKYEFIEIMNTTDSEIDLYKYCLGYCGSANTTLDSYEQNLVEITPIAEDWLDVGADVADNKKYTATAKNPASGVIAANEVAVLWIVTGDNYNENAMTTSVADFRSTWGIGEDVKVFMVDGNTASDKNFNMKNSAVGTYVIAEYNETLEAKANVKGSDGYVTLDGWMNDPYIISWATLNYSDKNSPSYIVNLLHTFTTSQIRREWSLMHTVPIP